MGFNSHFALLVSLPAHGVDAVGDEAGERQLEVTLAVLVGVLARALVLQPLAESHPERLTLLVGAERAFLAKKSLHIGLYFRPG